MMENGPKVEVVEVAHEAMLRQWETLQRWLKELSASLIAAESLRRAANDWRRGHGDEALLVHTAHRLDVAEALLCDERLEGRFDSGDRKYVSACRVRQRRMTQEREEQLQQIARQQSARAKLQKRASWGLAIATVTVISLSVWIITQVREINLQISLLLASAAETSADTKHYDRALRLGLLAASSSWLQPMHPIVAPIITRAADGSMLHTLINGHSDQVTSAGFSLDSKRVVTASWDSTARVWDAETGKPVGEPMMHDSIVNTASFSPDGKRVITASNDKTARIWNALWPALSRSDDLIREVCQHKLRGEARRITELDARVLSTLLARRIGEDVCEGY
jgi:hypothetical protein